MTISVSVKVATDLNVFEVPVKVTAIGKNLVNTQALKLEVEATVVKGVTVNGNIGYVVGTKKLSTGVGAKYAADTFTVEDGVAYGVTVGTENSNVLFANASVSTTALIPGAELKLSYGKAKNDMNFLANQTVAQNFGKVVATYKIEF